MVCQCVGGRWSYAHHHDRWWDNSGVPPRVWGGGMPMPGEGDAGGEEQPPLMFPLACCFLGRSKPLHRSGEDHSQILAPPSCPERSRDARRHRDAGILRQTRPVCASSLVKAVGSLCILSYLEILGCRTKCHLEHPGIILHIILHIHGPL